MEILILTESNIKPPLPVRVLILCYLSNVSVILKKFILLMPRNKEVLHEGIEENQRRTSVRIASVPVKIRTKHLPNTNLEHYCYTSSLV
jgi:hypothetical protein